MDGGAGASAVPVYNKFVELAKALKPEYISMIMPAKWYSGGKGLNDFRKSMITDKRIVTLHDFIDGHDCFPTVDIAGGICYFLWNKLFKGTSTITTHYQGIAVKSERELNSGGVFIRHIEELTILNKVKSTSKMFLNIYSRKPFGLPTTEKGMEKGDIKIRYNGGIAFFERAKVTTNRELIDKWKVIISRLTAEHAGETDKNGQKKIISTLEIIAPEVVCSETYLLLKVFDTEQEAVKFTTYIKTKFVRSLIAMLTPTQQLSRSNFSAIPLQNFTSSSDINWSQTIEEIDKQLYTKYHLSEDEIAFIERMIKPMA